MSDRGRMWLAAWIVAVVYFVLGAFFMYVLVQSGVIKGG